MTVIFHRTVQNDYTDRLLEAVSTAIPIDRVHVSGDIESFVHTLLAHRIDRPIVVVQLGTIKDVTQFKDLRDILDGLFLIVATDGHDDELLFRSRELYPRFLTHNKEDLGVVAAVIEKPLAMNGRDANT